MEDEGMDTEDMAAADTVDTAVDTAATAVACTAMANGTFSSPSR